MLEPMTAGAAKPAPQVDDEMPHASDGAWVAWQSAMSMSQGLSGSSGSAGTEDDTPAEPQTAQRANALHGPAMGADAASGPSAAGALDLPTCTRHDLARQLRLLPTQAGPERWSIELPAPAGQGVWRVQAQTTGAAAPAMTAPPAWTLALHLPAGAQPDTARLAALLPSLQGRLAQRGVQLSNLTLHRGPDVLAGEHTPARELGREPRDDEGAAS